MKHILAALIFMINTLAFSQSVPDKIDSYITHLMERQDIPGASVAVISKGEVLHKKTYGFANLEHQVPMKQESIFRVYSLTKPFVAVAIFQLIEQGKLTLNDPLDQYIEDLPDAWKDIQVRHLLSHSSGLPDMSPIPAFMNLTEQEAKDTIYHQEKKYPTGLRYDYNQTGFYFLQKIIEQLSGVEMADFILKEQALSSKQAFYSSDSRDIIQNRVTPYFPFAKPQMIIDHSYLQGTYAHAMNGMNITMDAMIDWDKNIRENNLITKETRQTMWSTFPYANGRDLFTYGWDKISVNGHPSYGFTGSLCTAYRIFPEDDLSIILFTNGLGHFYNIDNAVDHLASLVDETITNKNNLAFETLLRASYDQDITGFALTLDQARKQQDLSKQDVEYHLNDIAYFWMRSLKNPVKAIEYFTLNNKLNPESWNTYDSLAEGHENAGNITQAISNYERAVSMSRDILYQAKTQAKIDRLKNK